jgi:hypothetical protein
MNPLDPPTKFQVLREEIENLKSLLDQMRGLTDVKVHIRNLERSHQHTQEFFQTQLLDQILPTEDDLIPYYVEINKQLRLLGADVSLLKTSRQSLNQRFDKAGDRITLLLTYCKSLPID